jgi:hypothetical protein
MDCTSLETVLPSTCARDWPHFLCRCKVIGSLLRILHLVCMSVIMADNPVLSLDVIPPQVSWSVKCCRTRRDPRSGRKLAYYFSRPIERNGLWMKTQMHYYRKRVYLLTVCHRQSITSGHQEAPRSNLKIADQVPGRHACHEGVFVLVHSESDGKHLPAVQAD